MNKTAEDLFNENTKLVYHVLHTKFQGSDTHIDVYDYEDIVQIANIGLWKACITFDPDKKIAFSTYASKVIYNEILQIFRKCKKYPNDIISLNEFTTNDNGDESELLNIIPSKNADYNMTLCELRSYIYNKYKDSDKELQIINSYVFEKMTQNELSEKYGYSQGHISRILNKFKKDFKDVLL